MMIRDDKEGFVRDVEGDFLNTHFLLLKEATGGLDLRHHHHYNSLCLRHHHHNVPPSSVNSKTVKM